MKTIRKGFLLLAVALLFAGAGFAQGTLKIGYIDSGKLMNEMPETDTAQVKLKQFEQTMQSQLQTMGQEYKNKVQAYQNNVGTMSDLIRQTKEKEIGDLQQRIQAFQSSAQDAIQQKQQALYQPIIKKVKDAIDAVGKEYHYTYILDVSQGLVLYYNGDDVTPLVKKKLGLK
jgi:outer membrane protein